MKSKMLAFLKHDNINVELMVLCVWWIFVEEWWEVGMPSTAVATVKHAA